MSETTGIPDLDVGGGLDTLNSTAVVAALTPTNIAWAFLQDFDFFLLEARMVFSAIGIIYVAAHASLRRPPSAGPEKPRKPGSGSRSKKRGEDDERVTQGLMLSDAILFPIMAAHRGRTSPCTGRTSRPPGRQGCPARWSAGSPCGCCRA